ncbi:MAG TPA: arsenosugar biosynthesis radical SAM (seleno)protein ArsS [Nevskiaceae bacterium]|nr:arsenosugar biosynthesis radical SAM (seleno)protein ArsS [Nevskiaceae bacterium]
MNAPGPARHDFAATLARHGLQLPVQGLDTLQVNLTLTCNQACRHCHVDASPARREALSAEGVAACLHWLARDPAIRTLDLTGGAPELHPQFRELVRGARALGRQVMVRHNLTVQLDPHPLTGESLADLPAFFAEQAVEVVSSLPYYEAFFTDTQRGKGVFEKSLEALRRLNARGYGDPASGLVLNLVYNPVGPYLPAAQASLEADYRRVLGERHGLRFNRLYALTNVPIHRFALHLRKTGQYEAYLDKLLAAFNPAAAEGVMCRRLISVDHRGRLYDCDFNQQIGLQAEDAQGQPLSLDNADRERLLGRPIRFGSHCLACTAGAGSSCGGATA